MSCGNAKPDVSGQELLCPAKGDCNTMACPISVCLSCLLFGLPHEIEDHDLSYRTLILLLYACFLAFVQVPFSLLGFVFQTGLLLPQSFSWTPSKHAYAIRQSFVLAIYVCLLRAHCVPGTQVAKACGMQP